MEHIWTMLMHKILQNHLLRAFVANLKIDAIYALYPESFCGKNLAIRKVFAFCDSGNDEHFGRTIAACVLVLNCTNVFRALFLSPAITFILLGKYASVHILAVLNM